MAKQKDYSWVIVGLVTAGLALLYYAQTGMGNEKDSALLPNTLEAKINMLIAALNQRLGKRWVDFSVGVLKEPLRKMLPPSLVGLVDVVATVENTSKGTEMTGYEKQQLAVCLARGTQADLRI